MASKAKKQTKSKGKSVKSEPKTAKRVVKTETVPKEKSAYVSQGLSQQVTSSLASANKKILARRAFLASQAEETANELSHDSFSPLFGRSTADFEERINDMYEPEPTNSDEEHNPLFASDPLAGVSSLGTWETGRDLFKESEEYCTKKGDLAKYRIYLNGENRGTRTAPYSWEKASQEFGPGQCRIQAFSASSGRILRTETQQLGVDPAFEAKKAESAQVQQQQTMDPLAIFALMTQEREKVEAKLRMERQEKREEESALMKLVMAMTQAQTQGKNDSTTALQQMMLDMQKANFEMLNQMRNDTAKMFDSLNNKKDTISNFELLKLVQDSRNGGWEQAQKFYEMLDEKAEKKAEEIAEARESGSGDSDSKDSMTDTLIKAFAPAVAGMMTKQVTGPQAPAQVPQRIARPAPPARPTSVPAQAPVQAASQAPAAPAVAGMPRANLAQPAPATVVTNATKTNVIPTNDHVASKNNIDAPVQVTQNKTEVSLIEVKIRDLAIPLIADKLVNQVPPRTAAIDVLFGLQNHGLTVKDVVDNWSLSKLLKVAQESGVPDVATPWFKEFFDEIEQISKLRRDSSVHELTNF